MQASNDPNLFKILDFIGNSDQEEILKFREKLVSEDEQKIYDCCVSQLKCECERTSAINVRSLKDVIHSKTSSREIDEVIGEDYFRQERVGPEKIDGLIQNIAKISQQCSVITSSIVGKMEETSRLPSENLAAYFEDVKESEGVDDYMHRIFLTTNEGEHAKVQEVLKREPLVGNTFLDGHGGNTLIAVSGFCGLNLASVRGEELGGVESNLETLIVLDRSNRVAAFWKAMQEIILSSETRQEVVAKLEKLVQTDLFRVDNLPSHIKYQPLAGLREEIMSGASWLSTTRRFKIVKQIFESKRFIFKRIDLTDLKAMHSLKEALQKAKCKIDTFYVSNISEYLRTDELDLFKQGIMEVADDKMLIVDTVPRASINEALNQRIVKFVKEKMNDSTFCSSSVCLLPPQRN